MATIDAFTDKEEGLAAMLAMAQDALNVSAPASLLLSGGSSPVTFYERLGAAGMADTITTALVDERWVDMDDAGSNAALVARHLLAVSATAVHFENMKTAHATPHEAEAEVNALYESLPRPALSVLGMGPDSHTASWFAEAREYEAVSTRGHGRLVGAVTAPKNDITGAYQMRMTITADMLDRSAQALLLVIGESRLDILRSCLAAAPSASPIGRAADILGARLHIVALTGDRT